MFPDAFRMYKKEPLARNGLSKLYFPNFTFTNIIVTSFTMSKIFWIIGILQAIVITRFKLCSQQWVQTDFSHIVFVPFCTPTASGEILLAPSYPCPRLFFITKFNFSNTCIISVATNILLSYSHLPNSKNFSPILLFLFTNLMQIAGCSNLWLSISLANILKNFTSFISLIKSAFKISQPIMLIISYWVFGGK